MIEYRLLKILAPYLLADIAYSLSEEKISNSEPSAFQNGFCDLFQILNDKTISIETNPVDIYKAWRNHMEMETGKTS